MNAPADMLSAFLVDLARDARVRRIPPAPAPVTLTAQPRHATLNAREGWSQASSCSYDGCDCPAEHSS